MKSIKFDIGLKFSDNVKFEHINEIAENIANAIQNQVENNSGITPANADYDIKECEVSQILAQKPVTRKL